MGKRRYTTYKPGLVKCFIIFVFLLHICLTKKTGLFSKDKFLIINKTLKNKGRLRIYGLGAKVFSGPSFIFTCIFYGMSGGPRNI